MKKNIWNGGLAAALTAGLLWAGSLTAFAAPVFPEGISLGGQSLAGMTADEAEAAAADYVKAQGDQTVTLNVDGQDVTTTARGLGCHWANESAVKEAAAKYAGGSLIRQYMAKKDLAGSPVDLPLEVKADSGSVAQFVNSQCQDMGTAPRDAAIVRENGAFVITESAPGKTVDAEATEEALNQAFAQGLKEPVWAEAVIVETEPAVTTEDLASIQDVLGSATTSFASSGSARSTNVSVGASKINGRVLMPGEVLSGYECLQPFTSANGYKGAASYANGQVVDSIGGGVCQVSTTLYNAALEAELEIVQRQNHSMIVTYVDPSMDAAIAGTVKDLKIKNNYSTPIYVEGYTQDKKITFTIYGKETRPANRQVEYVSETLGRTSPGDPQLIVDPSLAPGAQVRVQSSHTGLRSRLWKVVTVDGVEQERTLLNEDTYNASKAIYRVGPSLPVTLPTETQDPTAGGTAGGETSPAETGPVTGVDGGPGVSPQPSGQDSGTGGGESAPAPAPTEGAAGPGAVSPAPAPETTAGAGGAAPAPETTADPGSAAPAPAQILPVSPEAGA